MHATLAVHVICIGLVGILPALVRYGRSEFARARRGNSAAYTTNTRGVRAEHLWFCPKCASNRANDAFRCGARMRAKAGAGGDT